MSLSGAQSVGGTITAVVSYGFEIKENTEGNGDLVEERPPVAPSKHIHSLLDEVKEYNRQLAAGKVAAVSTSMLTASTHSSQQQPRVLQWQPLRNRQNVQPPQTFAHWLSSGNRPAKRSAPQAIPPSQGSSEQDDLQFAMSVLKA